MPYKPRRKEKPAPSLKALVKGKIAKEIPLEQLKGQVPEDVLKDIKHKKMKKTYDSISKTMASSSTNQSRKEDLREEYKVRRRNAIGHVKNGIKLESGDKDIKTFIKKEMK